MRDRRRGVARVRSTRGDVRGQAPAPFSAPARFPVSRGRSKAYCPESHKYSCRTTSCRSSRGRSFTLSTNFPTNGTWSRTLGGRSVSSRPITCRKACRPRWKSSRPLLRPMHTSTNQGSHAPQHRQRMPQGLMSPSRDTACLCCRVWCAGRLTWAAACRGPIRCNGRGLVMSSGNGPPATPRSASRSLNRCV